ncbi:MAG: hypothetical protein K1X65_25220 [Caldilineales bacterium]|nr:hypothetical protein [Caldilineales bacterium]MCW5859330.1 hypothetical protein [Caldilineales bacterium]
MSTQAHMRDAMKGGIDYDIIGADGASAKTRHEIVAWAVKHSPVSEPLTRVMPTESALEIV